MVYIEKKGSYFMPHDLFNEEGYIQLGKLFIGWKNITSTKLDNKSIDILRFFILNVIGSAYRCNKFLNDELRTKISYKNTHKKIKKLYDMGFIDLVNSKQIEDNHIKENSSLHGAKFYKISSLGYFYSIVKRLMIINDTDMGKLNIPIHENFFIYENLLFHHIPKKIIEKLSSYSMEYSIMSYIQECCNTIEIAFNHISKQTYITSLIEKTDGMLYCPPFMYDIIVEELRAGKSFRTLDRIDKKSKN